jgi:hypothetical protein
VSYAPIEFAPGIRIEEVPFELRESFSVRIEPGRADTPKIAAIIDQVWERANRSSDRLYNGPILAVRETDGNRGRVTCTRSDYKHLLAAELTGDGTRMLGVTGIVQARDTGDADSVLLGRRSSATRVYGGMWECAPSGGVSPPLPESSSISGGGLLRALSEEGMEELGWDTGACGAWIVALLHDDLARSVDVVIAATLVSSPPVLPCQNKQDRWEYVDLAWVPKSQLEEFCARHSQAISPPTLALLKYRDWIG